MWYLDRWLNQELNCWSQIGKLLAPTRMDLHSCSSILWSTNVDEPQPSLAQQPSLPLQKSYWINGQLSTSKCNNNGGQTNVITERAACCLSGHLRSTKILLGRQSRKIIEMSGNTKIQNGKIDDNAYCMSIP